MTIVLNTISTTIPPGGRIVIQLPTQMSMSATTTCGVVHDLGAVAGTTTRVINSRQITWTLSSATTLLNTAGRVTVIICSGIGNPRMEVAEPTVSLVSYTAASAELDRASVRLNAFVRSPLGSVRRSLTPDDPRAGAAPGPISIALWPLTNSLIGTDEINIQLPSGFLPGVATPTAPAAGTVCQVSQSAQVTSTTALDGSLIRITLSGPVLAAETVNIRCTNVRNPTAARGTDHGVIVRTRTSTGAVIDQTLQATMATITNAADPSARAYVQQSFVVYRSTALTTAQRTAIEQIYCQETSTVCGSASVMWQYRSFRGDALTLSVGVYPSASATTAGVASAVTSGREKIVARVRELLATHTVDIGTPLQAAIPGSCFNGVKDATESDLDCGGISCPQCGERASCVILSDCSSFNCVNLKCTEITSVLASTMTSAAPALATASTAVAVTAAAAALALAVGGIA
jgi:hypothetical protein